MKKMWCLYRNMCVAHVIAEVKVGVAVGFVGRFGRRGEKLGTIVLNFVLSHFAIIVAL